MHAADGAARFRLELPDEEALASHAARCRPFILNNDTVYHAKVLEAIGYFARGSISLVVAGVATPLRLSGGCRPRAPVGQDTFPRRQPL